MKTKNESSYKMFNRSLSAILVIVLAVSLIGCANLSDSGSLTSPEALKCKKFASINEALKESLGDYFWIARDGSEYSTGHTDSYYKNVEERDKLTFDISNNNVLLNTLYNGTLKEFVFFRSTYYSDFFPGGWIQADFTRAEPLSFGLTIGDNHYDLDKVDWPFKTGYLAGFFPMTQYTHEGMDLKILSFAPISSDGSIRPRVGIYGLMLENKTQEPLIGKFTTPYTSTRFTPRPKLIKQRKSIWSRRNAVVLVADGLADSFAQEVPFELKPGEHIWLPCVISPYGDYKDYELVDSKGTLHWLNESWTFFENMTGHIEMKDDPWTAELIQRSIMQNFNSPQLDGSGDLATTMFGGAFNGAFDPHFFVGGNNIKNSYYPFVPLSMFQPELVKTSIRWFLKYGIRPKGPLFEGGISHSLGNSVASVMLAGLYYQHTGDKAFFHDNKDFKGKFIDLLDKVLETREDEDVFLFPSLYISDGYSHGDYHTGSNISAWYAFKSFARILKEVYNDSEKADHYLDISHKIKEDIDKLCVVDGPFGKQFNEGGNKEGTKQLPLLHDGEESAVNLAPLYGYFSYDDTRYLNFNKFAVTTHNPCYNPETKGIYWEKYPEGIKPSGGLIAGATSPGYITALASCTDKETMSGPQGHLTEIKRLTDVNGQTWWWPYKVRAKRGDVSRSCAPCDFVMSSFLTLMVSEYLGVKYDAPSNTLSFRPFLVSDDFSWKGLRMGSGRFNVKYKNQNGIVEACVENLNKHAINLRIEIIPNENQNLKSLSVNGKPTKIKKNGSFLERKTIIVEKELPAEELTCILAK